MKRQTITLLKIATVIFDIGLFYLAFWIMDKFSRNGIYAIFEWWILPTFLLSELLLATIGFFLTIITFYCLPQVYGEEDEDKDGAL